MLQEIIKYKIYIFLISQAKLNSSFQAKQYIIKSYSTPSKLYRNQNSGGLLLYVSEKIQPKILNEYTSQKLMKNSSAGINLRSRR